MARRDVPLVDPVASLSDLLPAKRLRTDQEALEVWGLDRTTSFAADPVAVVFPETIEEVRAIVARANTSRFALVPSGGRTGLSGGAVAASGQVVLSLDRMNQILAFSPTDRLVTCQAGVVTQILQEFAEEHGLFYPVDFASAGSSHIGGNIATNAGGIKVIRYGLTRDWVTGLRVVTGSGELLECNQGLVKNATGYDFRHLFIGSEGTLGIVVEADIRLLPAPEPQQVMVLGVPELGDLLKVLAAFSERMPLSAFEFFSQLALDKVIAHKTVAPPLEGEVPFYALLEFDESASETALSVFLEVVERGWVNDGVQSQSARQAENLWYLREAISESLSPYSPYKNDVAVRVSDVPEFLTEVDALVSNRYPDFEVCWYGHIGDGNLHLNILKPDSLEQAEFYERCHAISPELFALVETRQGSISAEHGVGLLKKDFLSYSRSPAEIELMKGLKGVFDPNGVLNPDKLFP